MYFRLDGAWCKFRGITIGMLVALNSFNLKYTKECCQVDQNIICTVEVSPWKQTHFTLSLWEICKQHGSQRIAF